MSLLILHIWLLWSFVLYSNLSLLTLYMSLVDSVADNNDDICTKLSHSVVSNTNSSHDSHVNCLKPTRPINHPGFKIFSVQKLQLTVQKYSIRKLYFKSIKGTLQAAETNL